ncbi:MAG: DegT/DnrJ/EryC1/StrS family aminotransferase [Spirochaetales bacterium]|nr:DegT/DnrJ/EryC1/StrS family aminotransferase [Spirochaetales bacterium]
MSIALFKPTIKRKDMDSVLTCLVSDQIGPSALADDLIATISSELGTHGGCALREFPRALSLLLDTLELQRGDKVILSPLAPQAYSRVFAEKGIVPLYADVTEEKGAMDPEKIVPLMEEEPKAIFAVHTMGFIQPMEELGRFGLPLIEDISQSLGAQLKEEEAGSWGQYVLLGMESHHIITSGGGALLLGRSEEETGLLDEKCSELCVESFLPDMNGSLGLVQWSQLEGFLEKRRQLAELFNRSSSRGRHSSFRPEEGEEPSWYAYPLYLKDSMKEIRQYARKKGVETAMAFGGTCIDFMEDRSLCPVASRLAMGTLLFPLYPMMGQKNGELISRVLTTLP